MDCDEEKMILFATSIAMQLAKGLDEQELESLRNLINQISCSLTNLVVQRHCFIDKKTTKI